MARCIKCGEFMFFKTDSGLCAACEEERITGARLRLRHGRIVSAPGEGEDSEAEEYGFDPEAFPEEGEEYPEEED